MDKRRMVLGSDFGRSAASSLLERIKAGETVTPAERLEAIKSLMATSPRDWSPDPELWTIYQLAFFERGHFEETE